MLLDPTRTVPFEDLTPLLADPAALRARADADGVLFFRGLLPASDVRSVRHDILAVLRGAGLLDERATNDLAYANIAAYDRLIADGDYGDTGLTKDLYRQIQRLESFHTLALHPAVLRIYESLFGCSVFPHPRNIARVQIPGTVLNDATPSHQDYIFIQGNERTWTMWAPLGDCPEALGGLTVLRGSHKYGVLDYQTARGAGGFEAYICGLDCDWIAGDYRAGDVITFDCRTVHKALPNSTDTIRLSVDFRYQPVDLPLVAASLEPHVSIGTWEDLYQGWSDSYPRYYWTDLDLLQNHFDPLVRWQKKHIC